MSNLFILTIEYLSIYIDANLHVYTDACVYVCLQLYILSEFSISKILRLLNFCICKFPDFFKYGNPEILEFLYFCNCRNLGSMDNVNWEILNLGNPEIVPVCTIAPLYLHSSLAKSAQVTWTYFFFCHCSKTTTFDIISKACLFNDET